MMLGHVWGSPQPKLICLLGFLGLLGCSACSKTDGDRRGECGGQEARTCTCPDGSESLTACISGRPGACDCGPTEPLDAAMQADAEGPNFANPMLDASFDLPDVSLPERTDAREIEVDTTCGEQESQAVISEERPVDVIFVIDNSGSMSNEIGAVERNINQNFAQIIEESGADYRVIMITYHGAASYDVCIDQPLASAPCSVSQAGDPANGPRFFHYDINVQSWNSVCLMLQHYQVDPLLGPLPETGAAAAPTGWNEWLRPDALKVFVEITDDRLSCSAVAANPLWDFQMATTVVEATQVARQVYSAIQGLSSAQFGTPEEPRFIWHSIVGIADNDPVELPYTHFDPPRIDPTSRCDTAVNSGPAYQMLSISTGGLRYPVCAADAGHGYDSVFRAIAHEVVRGSRVECAFNIPTPPPGKFVDYASVVVDYTPGDGSDIETFGRVGQSDCNDASFYFESGEIKLCPSACTRVRADETANVSVVFGCGPEVELDPDLLD